MSVYVSVCDNMLKVCVNTIYYKLRIVILPNYNLGAVGDSEGTWILRSKGERLRP